MAAGPPAPEGMRPDRSGWLPAMSPPCGSVGPEPPMAIPEAVAVAALTFHSARLRLWSLAAVAVVAHSGSAARAAVLRELMAPALWLAASAALPRPAALEVRGRAAGTEGLAEPLALQTAALGPRLAARLAAAVARSTVGPAEILVSPTHRTAAGAALWAAARAGRSLAWPLLAALAARLPGARPGQVLPAAVVVVVAIRAAGAAATPKAAVVVPDSQTRPMFRHLP